MCTVTFIPANDRVYLSSNRDEWHTRSIAAIPAYYINNGQKELLFPKDPDKGGTWILAKNNGDAAVLLNGAFKPHHRKDNYSKSRGIALLEIMMASSPMENWKSSSMEGIEPFTLVLYVNNELIECRWDGNKKHETRLSNKTPHIWSSVTLYESSAMQERKQWFNEWQKKHPMPAQEDILHFHQHAGAGKSSDALVMNREDKVATVSITSMEIKPGKITMIHQDMKTGDQTMNDLLLQNHKPIESKKVPSVLSTRLRTAWIRISHWEYWPFDLLYIPVYVYWAWLSLRARSLFFFSAANPLIKNAGFLMESKKEIYDQMPEGLYPTTVFCRKGMLFSDLLQSLKQKDLSYPLIAKPDIGQRGMRVKLISNDHEMKAYLTETPVDFLVQEFINYKNEAGIFYYRIPGEAKGIISGIVGKEFLTVKGDGVSTIEKLLTDDPRYFLQLPVLRNAHNELMSRVLKFEEEYELVPYGNHSRGAKFIDLSNLISPALTETIDRVCRSVPEFYYGRLDIRYSTWEDLCKGKNLSVIELNGAGSEPTHIYDPAHSVFFAWKEIIRHLRFLYRISRINSKQKGIKLMTTKEGLAMLKENRAYLKLLKE